MIQLLSVCFFSFLGALLRFLITVFVSSKKFPYATLLCNSAACMLMGAGFAFAAVFAVHQETVQNTVYAFLGALSTFSTFSHDSYMLFVNKGLFHAFLNIMLNLCFGILFFAFGFIGVFVFL